MKKAIKKLMAAMLAAAMVLAMAIPAFAATSSDRGSITVQNTVKDKEYKIYKILDLETNGTGPDGSSYTAFKYKPTTEWASFVKSYPKFDEKGEYVVWTGSYDNDSPDAREFAEKAYNALSGKTATKTQIASSSTVTFNDLELGYYLVVSDMGAVCSLDTTKPDATVREKNGAPSVDKKVQENSTSDFVSSNDANIGDTVTFRTTIHVTDGNPTNYVLHDKMSAGLTFQSVTSITKDNGATTLTNGTDYEVVTDSNLLADTCTFEVKFKQNVKTNDEIVVTYTAVINDQAKVGDAGNSNETHLDYGDNQHSTTSETQTYVWSMEIYKYTNNGTAEISLSGAQFRLSKTSNGTTYYAKTTTGTKKIEWVTSETEATTFISDDNGKILIEGLDSGAYTLTEIKAPDGYNGLDEPITIKIDGTDSNSKGTVHYTIAKVDGVDIIRVLNNAGTILPGTGGIGTTIFYIVGGGLMIAAAVLLITKKRMDGKN